MRVIALFLIVFLSAYAQSPTVVVSDADSREAFTSAFLYDASGNISAICKTSSTWAATTTFSVDAATLTSIVDSSTTATVTTASAHGLAVGNPVVVTGTVAEFAAAAITSITDSSNTSTIVFAAAHGLLSSDVITISGITTDTDLNGTFVFTKTAATTGTITTANVTDAAYVPATDTGMAIAVGDSDLSGTYTIQTVPSTTTFTITTANVTDGNYLFSGHQFTTTAPRTTDAVWSVKRYEYNSTGDLILSHWADGNTQPDNVCVATVSAK